MFLSTPLTVTLMVVAFQFPSSQWVAILLSSDGEPEGADKATPDPSKTADRVEADRPRALTQA
jgi:hypothetical protein